MFIQSLNRSKIELTEVKSEIVAEAGRLFLRATGVEDRLGRLSRSLGAFFGMRAGVAAEADVAKEPPLGVFREKASGLLRIVHKEVMLRFEPRTDAATRTKILDKFKLEQVGTAEFAKLQWVVRFKDAKRSGADMVELANQLTDLPEIVFATPNFVSEYRRSLIDEQWHLKNTAHYAGQKAGEDAKAEGAWAITQGKSSIVVAVLDDGVDLKHPDLKKNIKKKPNPADPNDKFGRDFFLPNTHPEHYDPNPKLFQYPYDQMTGNDIHGTCCAGVIAASGASGGVLGIAPKCKILAVKIFHADALASDARVADAIRYAARFADVLSCSWSGGNSPDIELALADALTLGRGGKGAPVFCAAGNANTAVQFPAKSASAIAIGASTDQGKRASYSCFGPELWVVAPSNGGVRSIYTSDVSIANRGFNTGTAAAGGIDGLHTNSFGGTSSATPLAAGVAALMLSANPKLTAVKIKEILRDTADRIGPDHNAATGHSDKFGYGRVNADKAVAQAKATP